MITFAVKALPSGLSSAIVGAGIYAAVPEWATDLGTLAAVIVSMATCATVIYRSVSRAFDLLWRRFLEDARDELGIPELAQQVHELRQAVQSADPPAG